MTASDYLDKSIEFIGPIAALALLILALPLIKKLKGPTNLRTETSDLETLNSNVVKFQKLSRYSSVFLIIFATLSLLLFPLGQSFYFVFAIIYTASHAGADKLKLNYYAKQSINLSLGFVALFVFSGFWSYHDIKAKSLTASNERYVDIISSGLLIGEDGTLTLYNDQNEVLITAPVVRESLNKNIPCLLNIKWFCEKQSTPPK